MKLRAALTSSFLIALFFAGCGDDGGGTGGSAGTGGGSGTQTGTDASTGEGPASTPASTTAPSSTDTGIGGGIDAAATTGQGGATGQGGGSECSGETFTAASEDAFDFGGGLGYLALASADAPSDDLAIELYSDFGVTGARTIQDEDYATCDPCVLFRRACDENLGNCSQRFLAVEGTIEVDAFADRFTGALRDVVLVEVTLDDDLHSTPVVDGEVLCLDDYAFDALVQSGD